MPKTLDLRKLKENIRQLPLNSPLRTAVMNLSDTVEAEVFCSQLEILLPMIDNEPL